MTVFDEAHYGFSSRDLDKHLKCSIRGLEGNLRLQPIMGGRSNPTFFADYDNRRLVIRKKPAGAILPSAHAVEREHRILSALQDSVVPVPPVVLLETDNFIIGTPFYVMERVDGRIYADSALSAASPDDRTPMYVAAAEVLAALHSVDFDRIGLGDYGTKGGFYQRQIGRWSKQWQMSKTRDDPNVEKLLAWLPKHVPHSDETALVHGDFRIGNLIFHPTEPRVVAVLDWELSTLGHPMADLAHMCVFTWSMNANEYGGVRDLPLDALRLPSLDRFLDSYYHAAGNRHRISEFDLALALFRNAVIFEGIAARALAGNATSDDAEAVGALSPVFARRAVELID